MIILLLLLLIIIIIIHVLGVSRKTWKLFRNVQTCKTDILFLKKKTLNIYLVQLVMNCLDVPLHFLRVDHVVA